MQQRPGRGACQSKWLVPLSPTPPPTILVARDYSHLYDPRLPLHQSLLFADIADVPEEHRYPRPKGVPDELLETFASKGLRRTAQDSVMGKISFHLLRHDVHRAAAPLPVPVITEGLDHERRPKTAPGRARKPSPTRGPLSSPSHTPARLPGTVAKPYRNIKAGKYSPVLHTRHMSPAVETSVRARGGMRRVVAPVRYPSSVGSGPVRLDGPVRTSESGVDRSRLCPCRCLVAV